MFYQNFKWDISEDAKNENLQLTVHLGRTVQQVPWHARGDYLATVTAGESARQVLIHRLSTKQSQAPFGKSKGKWAFIL